MRNIRNKFSRPRVLWDLALIEEEKLLSSEYGLRRKKEIWAARSILRNFRERARLLNASRNKGLETALLTKTERLGLIQAGGSLDSVLSMTLKNILDRRLQTLLYKKGLSQSIKQARQLITHGHVYVDGKKSTFPSLLVPINEDGKITIVGISSPQEPPKVVPAEIVGAEESGEPSAEIEAVGEAGG